MFFRDKDKPMVAKGLIMASVAAALVAMMGAFGHDLFMASSQWMLVAATLGIWGIYFLVEAHFRL